MTLTADEIRRANERAEVILEEDIGRGYQMYFQPGKGEDRLSVNIRGFGAELAAARVTGLELDWSYLASSYRRSEKRPDLGLRTEVRNAKSADGRLWASRYDHIENVFLLVTGSMPTFTVRGWIEGHELLVPENHLSPPEVRYAGWFMRPEDLNPFPLPEDA